jgi:hypothetical protein
MPDALITTPAVMSVLSRFGWTPDRTCDVNTWIKDRETVGFVSFPLAELVLANLGGLTVKLPGSLTGLEVAPIEVVEFDPTLVSFDSTRVWQNETGLRLFPLGIVDRQVDLLLSLDGQCYLGFGPLWKNGENIDDALKNMFFGVKKGEMVWNPHSPLKFLRGLWLFDRS